MGLKSILITGCGPKGIGAALAKAFHMRGHTVFATGRSPAEIDPELASLGCRTLTMDVTSTTSIATAVRFVEAASHGRLDILVNNAGVLQVAPFADMSVEAARATFEINVLGVWAVTHAFLPQLLAARGIVANLCSVNQVFCPPFLAAYNASKAAVEALGRTLRRELMPLGVRVVALKTGSVRTPLFDTSKAVLPERSLYAPLRQWIESKGFLAQARFVEVEDYARSVVDDLLVDEPRAVIWRGGLATVAWLLSWAGWETMLDWSMIKGNQLDRLKPV
ncbi:short-chain dehydrogenase/reductase [Mycena sanguinolenta]|nr:short-chain dehydrogenase/reductase [Mycena sanguinolenta]